MSRWRNVCGAGLVLSAVCLSLRLTAADAPPSRLRPDSGRPYDIWRVNPEWTLGPVTAIAQSHDGYLWLGTYHGLVRYDGVRYTIFNSSNDTNLQTGHITSLCVDADGTLWIGHETGQLTRFAAGQFTAVPLKPNWRGAVEAITTDSQGQVWLLNDMGELYRVGDSLLLKVPGGASPTRKVTIARGEDGKLWVVGSGAVAIVEASRLVPYRFAERDSTDYYDRVAPARDGGLWVLGNGRLREWRDGRWVREIAGPPGALDAVTILFEMRSGPLLVGTLRNGLYLFEPGADAVHFNRQRRGLSHDWIRAVCEDHEGGIWVGTGGGLDGLRPRKVEMLSPPDQWLGCSVRSFVARQDGSLWVGTEGAGLYELTNGQWANFGTGQGLSNLFVWAVIETSDRQLYAGTWGGGIFVKQGDRFESPPNLAAISNAVTAFYQGRGGELWIGTRAGLFRCEHGKLTWSAGEDKLAVPDVRAFTETLDGTLWFAMSGGGLGSLKDGALRQYRQADGLSSDFIVCLYADADGTLWAGSSDNGLTRFKDGQFAVVSTEQGLPSGILCHILDDNAGNFWISSQNGIFRVNQAELNRCADGLVRSVHCLSYGTAEGLGSPACAGGFQPGAFRGRDGRLWFANGAGLAIIDPANATINKASPPVVIQELLVQHQPLAPAILAAASTSGLTLAADGSDTIEPRTPPAAATAVAAAGETLWGRKPDLRIGPGRQSIEFRYTALSFMAPEKVRFKRKLEGLDSDWVDVGAERVASYSFLPPGTYTFRIKACNNDGFWNEDGAAVTFMVLPYFWQTWWFELILVLTGAAAIGAGVSAVMRRRGRRKLEQVERQRALERERARIARDIHDDLGASLTRISMLSQSARGELEPQSVAAADLDQIYGTARELTRAMDEIVWAVNPKHDTLDSLVTYLGRFAQHFLSAAGLRCRLDVPLRLPAGTLTSEVRHNVFLAFKEALHNVVKHAHATEVRVSLELPRGGFALLVADNGQGFDHHLLKLNDPVPTDAARVSSGNGLANMQRRLEEIGGRCEWDTAPGEGTRVRFVVLASIAEARAADYA